MLVRTTLIAIALLAVSVSTAFGQQDREKGYSFSRGPSEMCGITGKSAADFRRQVSKSRKHKRVAKTDRFEVYESDDRAAQWAFTLGSEPAHPAATCRRVVPANGNFYLERRMVCEASRRACDRLVAEFEVVDEQARQAVRKALAK